MTSSPDGLSLAPFRGLRPQVGTDRLGRMLCPPYDVIDDDLRRDLLARDADNAVAVVLPTAAADEDPYHAAAQRLDGWVTSRLWAPDETAALYVYEMRAPDATVTRGLIGAVELRAPEDGVILPHENTMAGPVADRLALMDATQTDVEPIYLVYDGGGAATDVVREVDDEPTLARAQTPDGIVHRLWRVVDPHVHEEVARDLASRRALIADGHHRYATYRQLQVLMHERRGAGPWDRGLTLLVDATAYGPQVHAIHRVVRGLTFDDAVRPLQAAAHLTSVDDAATALQRLPRDDGFAAVLADGNRASVVRGLPSDVSAGGSTPEEPEALRRLDVSVLHETLVRRIWGLPDDEAVVGYAHTITEAIAEARRTHGTAVLLRPTPVGAVAAVATGGGRMPRKSTLFTPKPASGLVMRRFVDQ